MQCIDIKSKKYWLCLLLAAVHLKPNCSYPASISWMTSSESVISLTTSSLKTRRKFLSLVDSNRQRFSTHFSTAWSSVNSGMLSPLRTDRPRRNKAESVGRSSFKRFCRNRLHSSVVVNTKPDITGFGGLYSGIDQTFATSHSVEVELGRRHFGKVQILIQASRFGTVIILDGMRKGALAEAERNPLTIDVLLTHPSNNLRWEVTNINGKGQTKS